jgi:hypothetical protein
MGDRSLAALARPSSLFQACQVASSVDGDSVSCCSVKGGGIIYHHRITQLQYNDIMLPLYYINDTTLLLYRYHNITLPL